METVTAQVFIGQMKELRTALQEVAKEAKTMNTHLAAIAEALNDRTEQMRLNRFPPS